ncbi:hypothetical protein NQZ79_g5062 [Umbelopsis isabellina]|nr:hypothetical protein NQZ79_g5062 [Umbelopsis isabellina]
MKRFQAALLCLLVCLFSIPNVLSESPKIIHNAFVIEFNHVPTKRHLSKRRNHLYRRLNNENIKHLVRHEFKYMNAVSIEVDKPSQALEYIQSLHDVKRVWPVSLVTKPAVQVEEDGDSGTLIAANNMTGVYTVQHTLGLTGMGMKVGVIDTGIDYTHPALGGCFGPSCRVAYGHDFVGDKYDGTNANTEGPDPRDNCNGHGTHVAGIIGARDPESGFVGVAPDVTFGAYRIFGCTGSTADDIIMKAMEMAFDDGMDVINLSLGDQGWAESPTAALGNILAEKGMAVAAAAGNAGDKGIFEVGAPAVGRRVVSVASVDNSKVLEYAIVVNEEEFSYVTESGKPLTGPSVSIVATSKEPNINGDGCKPLAMNITGKYALISRGGCLFDEKAANAQNAGAAGVIIYNNEVGQLTPAVHDSKVKIPVAGLSREDGLQLLKILTSSSEIKVQIPKEQHSFALPTGGLISTFSSWGLAADLDIKPEISAPGGQIFSTFPVALGSYATLSGTSMACPHISGVMALIRKARGGGRTLDTATLRALIMNNAKPFKVYQNDYLDSVARQGAGLVNIEQAINTQLLIEPQSIPLGDKNHLASKNEYKIVLENLGAEAAEFQLSHLAAASVQAYEVTKYSQESLPLNKPEYIYDPESEAKVDFETSTVTVPAKSKLDVKVRIHPPVSPSALSIYSGYIVVQDARNGYESHVPYAGFTGSLSDIHVLFKNTTSPMVDIDEVVSATKPATLHFQLAAASAIVIIDVVSSANTTQSLGMIPGGYEQFLGRNDVYDPKDLLGLEWYGTIAESPEAAVSRNKLAPSLFGLETLPTSADKPMAILNMPGTKSLPNGKYHIRVSALRTYGNPKNPQDFDTWLSQLLEVRN